MFNLYGNDRLTEWKRFRESLETDPTPLKSLVDFWGNAPFVSRYLNPLKPEEWPDPWRLVLDCKLDDLAICLGMLYTLKLTDRFMGSKFEIHMSMSPSEKDARHVLIIDDQWVLNLVYKSVSQISDLKDQGFKLIWSEKGQI